MNAFTSVRMTDLSSLLLENFRAYLDAGIWELVGLGRERSGDVNVLSPRRA